MLICFCFGCMHGWIFLRPGKMHVPRGCPVHTAQRSPRQATSDPSYPIYHTCINPSIHPSSFLASLASGQSPKVCSAVSSLTAASIWACEPAAALALFIATRSKGKRIQCAPCNLCIVASTGPRRMMIDQHGSDGTGVPALTRGYHPPDHQLFLHRCNIL